MALLSLNCSRILGEADMNLEGENLVCLNPLGNFQSHAGSLTSRRLKDCPEIIHVRRGRRLEAPGPFPLSMKEVRNYGSVKASSFRISDCTLYAFSFLPGSLSERGTDDGVLAPRRLMKVRKEKNGQRKRGTERMDNKG